MRRKEPVGRDPSRRRLSEDDLALWQEVKKTVKPLANREFDGESGRNAMAKVFGRQLPLSGNQVENRTATGEVDPKSGKKTGKSLMRTYPAAPYSPPVSRPSMPSSFIDDHTARKLLKGKIPVDGRIDVHNMTQEHAHDVLLRFVANSHAAGDRIVLVITGKGRSGDGVLRQAVPKWLREPAFSLHVSAFRTAHVTHGGEGALYVRLRRKAGGRK